MKTTYKFKYLDGNRSVYVATLGKTHPTQQLYSRRTAFLTQPLYLQERKVERNVVIAFHTTSVMEYRLPDILIDQRNLSVLKDMEIIDDDDMPDIGKMNIHVTKVDDLKIHCDMLTIPLLIYDTVYCDIEEQSETYECFYYNANTNEKNDVP